MQTIITKYHGPGNVRASRCSATAAGGTRVYLEWDAALHIEANHNLAAIALARKFGWSGKMHSGLLPDGSRVYIFDNGSDALEVK